MERHIEVVALTSKGQLVIPQEIRRELHLQQGDKLMLLKENGTIVMKPIKMMNKEVEEELHELKLAEAGWKDIEAGRFVARSKEEFLKELAKW